MAKNLELETLETGEDKFGTVEENEWSKLIKARFKEGYVEGKYVGGESTVQTGFDHGYEKGFEMSYPISILKGLLAANELLQKDSNPDSLLRSKEVKQLLNEFEQKSMRLVKRSDENIAEDKDGKENLNGDESKVGKESSDEINEINKELSVLKKEVLMFLKDCNQPQIFEQIAHHFEKWNFSLPKNSLGSANNSPLEAMTNELGSTPEQC